MPRYRFTLDALTCHQPRSAGRYHDAVALGMWTNLPGQAPDPADMLISPLGLQGPRFTHLFGPGYTHSLAPDPSTWGPGFDRPWSLEIDLPESGANRQLSVVVWNQRHVEDPYKLSKTIVALAVAAGTGAAATLLPQAKDAFVAAIVGGLGGVASEAIKEVFGGLFDDWPKCAGLVFKQTLTLDVDDLADLPNPATLESETLEAVPEGCRQPRYTARLRVESAEPLRFPEPDEVVSKRYVPVDAPASSQWAGRWTDGPSSPRVSVAIEGTHLTSAAGDHAPAYEVTITERVTHRGGSRRLLDGEVFEPVAVVTRRAPPYDGTVVIGRWNGSVRTGVAGAQHQTALGGSTRGARVALRQRGGPGGVDLSAATSFDTGAALITGGSPASGLLRSLDSASTLAAAWADRIDPTTQRRRWTPGEIDEVVALALTEPGASLHIPAHDIVLRLYTLHERMGSGETRQSTVLRYLRADRIEATRADVELARYRPID